MPGFSTLLNTVTLSEFVDLVDKQFSMVQETVKPAAQQLYITEDLTSHSSSSKRYDEVDIETFAKLKREGENASKARAGVGYNKTMEAKRVAREIDITWEMRRYGQKHRIKEELKNLTGFVIQRVELDLSHRLTFSNATSFTDMDGETVTTTTGDGLALVSSVHTLKHASDTYSNAVSGNPVFSQGALELAEGLYVSDVLSNFGERRVIRANTIVSSDDPTTVRAIRQVLESTADVDAAHTGVVNVYEGKYTHVMLPYLATTALGARDSTKKKWWFLVASGQGAAGWQAYYGVFERPNMRKPVVVNGSEMLIGEDIHNDNVTFGTRGSHGIVTLAGRGLVASQPTSS